MKLYQVKIGTAYVTFVSTMMQTIDLTTREDRVRHIGEAEKKYVLQVFPYSEIKEFSVSEDKGNHIT